MPFIQCRPQYGVLRPIMCLLLATSGGTTLAQDKELFDLKLSELANLKVSIASHEAERIVDTPAVVTAYNAHTMQNLGLNTLEDVLSFVPGVVVQDTAIGTKAVMIRGIVEAFNQKVLFLLDGTPYWQPAHGGNPILAMPFAYIERVEVIRGPGGVIYGSNASGGVINVITKQSLSSSIDVSYDSLSSKNIGGYYQKKYSSWFLRLGAHDSRQEGYQGLFENRPLPPIYPSDTATSISLNKQQPSSSVWLAANSDGWALSTHYFESQNDGLAAAASTLNTATLKYHGTLIQGHIKQSALWGDVKTSFDINNFYLEIPTQSLLGFNIDGTQQFEDSGLKNNRYRLAASIKSTLSPAINWLNGVDLEQRETGDYQNVNEQYEVVTTSMEANETQEMAAYTQMDLTLGDHRWVLGGRFVDNELAGSDWLARMSYVYKFVNNQSLKVLYSEGFNAPTFVQQFIEIPPNVVKGNEDIGAEKIKTWELVYGLQSQHHFFVANIYRLKAVDFIFRRVNEAGIVEFSNTNEFIREGLDLDYRYNQDAMEFFSNMSWAYQGNENITKDSTALFVPKYTVNLGLSYALSHSIKIGGSLRHISQRESASALNIVNLNMSYQRKHWQLSSFIENALNETVEHPDVQNFSTQRLVPNKSHHGVMGVRFNYSF